MQNFCTLKEQKTVISTGDSETDVDIDGAVQCGIVQCSLLHYMAVQFSVVQCRTVQCRAPNSVHFTTL